MSKPIRVGLAAAELSRFVIGAILLVLAGWTFNASGQTETILYSFGGYPNDGSCLSAGLMRGSDGNFYGTTVRGGTKDDGTVFRISPSGGYTSLYSFAGSPNDGDGPAAGLVQGNDGNLYGTTYYGGVYNTGTVFRITPSGNLIHIHFFNGNDGAYPHAGLVLGSDGNFYGTTRTGGSKNFGTVFRMSPSGTLTSLCSFTGSPSDGAFPSGALVRGDDGNFYGTTAEGGMKDDGTVFRISPRGSYTNLYAFTDWGGPNATLVQGSDDNLYGTTSFGGENRNCSSGCGTIFRISPSGFCTSLYSFGNSPSDGTTLSAGLVQGGDGNFYGTTSEGGVRNYQHPSGYGTIFRISPNGAYTNLYFFTGPPIDGAFPVTPLVRGSDGSFYGTTQSGGTSTNCGSRGCGIVFRISPGGNSANR
jgi:uncharacterized repeat protein (TIGR03803 family)